MIIIITIIIIIIIIIIITIIIIIIIITIIIIIIIIITIIIMIIIIIITIIIIIIIIIIILLVGGNLRRIRKEITSEQSRSIFIYLETFRHKTYVIINLRMEIEITKISNMIYNTEDKIKINLDKMSL